MSETDDLKKRRIELYTLLKRSYSDMVKAKSLFDSICSRYEKRKKEWEQVDRQLAMLDGRFKVEEPNVSGKHRPVKKEFSLDELMQIKAKLVQMGLVQEEPEVEMLDEIPPAEEEE